MYKISRYKYINLSFIFLITTLLAIQLHPALLITDLLQLFPIIERNHIDDIVVSVWGVLSLLLLLRALKNKQQSSNNLKLIRQQTPHQSLPNKLSMAIGRFDTEYNLQYSNSVYRQYEQLIGKSILNAQISELFSTLKASSEHIQAASKCFPSTKTSSSNLGSVKWSLQKNENDYLLLGQDLTQQVEPEDILKVAKKILDATPVGVIITGADQLIQYTNSTFQNVTGYSFQDAFGQAPSLLNSGMQDKAFYQKMFLSLNDNGYWQGEIWNRKKDGSLYLQWLSVFTLKDSFGRVTHNIAMFTEITAQEEIRKKLHTLAYYDSLTSLANRPMFAEQLELLAQNRRDKQLCVIFIDIDGFKRINDSLGHQVGDQLLKDIAQRIKNNCREGDIVARWGGDEFIIAIEVSNEHSGVEKFCNKHLEQLRQPYKINNRELIITASMGVSVYIEGKVKISELIQNADIAMFQSKKKGKNRFEVFSPPHHTELLENIEIENSLRHAIRNNQIDVHFQPQICTDSSEIIGVEALARWHDQTLGDIAPQKFIMIAEENQIINELSNVIFYKALEQFKELQKQSPHLVLSLNLSASQLQDEGLVSSLKEATNKLNIAPSHLKLEVTEDVLMLDIQRSVDNIFLLKRMGFRISLDDFGTGYSSLSYLKDLEIDELKIDRSFVSTINDSERNKAIVSAIVVMSKELDIDCIIEGVETEDQLSTLHKMGCTRFQGYLFHKPMPYDKIFQLLKAPKTYPNAPSRNKPSNYLTEISSLPGG